MKQAIAFLLMVTVAAAAEPTLVIDRDGKLYYSGQGSGDEAVPISNVVRLPGAPPSPGPSPPPDDPDPDPQPPTGNVQKVSQWAKAANGTEEEATAIVLLANVLADEFNNSTDAADVKRAAEAWERATSILFPSLRPQGDWDEWQDKVDDLYDGKWGRTAFTEIAAGVADAYDVDNRSMDILAKRALKGAAWEEDADTILENVAELVVGEAVDINVILQIILQIITLLRDLGII